MHNITLRFFFSLLFIFYSCTPVSKIDFTESDLFKKANSSVVLVYSFNKNSELLGQGTGFVVKNSGIIATNNHVIKGANSLIVEFENGEKYDVTSIIAKDEERDIALIKINGYDLPVIKLGNSNNISIGQKVIAIGNPIGLVNTISPGLISGVRIEEYKLIQTTAPISPGSSGGPLLNMKGEVIGITTSGYDGTIAQNVNFAVPINYLIGLLNSDNLYPVSMTSQTESLEIKLELANKYYNNYEYYEAVRLFSEILLIDNTDPIIFYKLGFSLHKIATGLAPHNDNDPLWEDYAKYAIDSFVRTIELDPSAEPAYLKLGRVYGLWMIDAIKNKKPNELKKALKDAQKIGGFFPFVLEYNRAMLGSCSENAILFTNGDDDTFPAWYLQEIENVRKDVTIVNLSLLNSPFYIKYLRDFKGLDFNLSNEDIDLLKARSWPRPREEFISLYNEDKNGFFIDTMRLTIYESYLDSEGSGLLSISDQLSLLLIKKYLGYKDIYFSESTWYDASIPYSVFNYTVSEGLVNKLIPQPSDRIYSYEKWEENLFKNYTYSNFTDPRIFGSNTLYGPISSYRASFNELAQIYKYRSNKEKVREILDFKDTVIPYNNIPIPWDNLLDIYRNSQVPNLYDFSGLENPNFNMLDSLSQEYIMELKTTAIDSPYYYMDITTHYMEEGDWDNSYQYLKEYLKYKPTDKIRQQASMIIEFGLGNYQEGFKIGNELLNEDSDNISIIDLLAFKSMEKKQYDIAATYFDRLLVINDYDYNTYNSYGLLHLYQKQYDLAINKFKKVLDYAPTYKDNYKYALSNIAETYIAMGENEKAITLYKELIEIDPTMSLAYSKLAILYYQENNKPITDELIQIATDNMFAGSYGQLGLACYYSYINNLEQSYYYLETAIKMGFSDIGWIEYDPHLDNIKGTKRFENLINSIVRN